MTREQMLNEAEKANLLKMNGTMQEKVEQALGVCSKWVADEAGELNKECYKCCYWDPEDIATMVCSEHLMEDALTVILEQKGKETE